MKPNSPNLFIVGAPKCGTSTLAHWISQHPDIYICPKKEPAIFCNFHKNNWQGPGSEIFFSNIINDIQVYESLFSGSENYFWKGEASTDYLWCKDAPRNIANAYGTTDNKFIIVLRNPIDRAFSEHSHLIRDNLEQYDFITSIKLENERFKKCWQPLFYHVKRSLYYSSIKRYFRIFSKNNILILFFEDLKNEPTKLLTEIFNFLNLPKHPVDTNLILNKSGTYRFNLLNLIIRKDYSIKKYAKKFTSKNFRVFLKSHIDSINLRKQKISQIEKEFMIQFFIKDICNVEYLLNCNLDHWKV